MPNYRHKTTGQYPVSEQEIRALFPNVMFPAVFQHADYDVVFPSPQPTYDPVTQTVREIAPILTAPGHYEQQWQVVELFPLPADKTAAITANLAKQVAAFIKQIDTDTDYVYGDVAGNRQSEYELAEKDAIAYKAAGYTGTVPVSVTAWATAKGWTNTQAADDIIATATAWRTAQGVIRTNRLARKEDARNATTVAQLDTARATWNTFLTSIKTQLSV